MDILENLLNTYKDDIVAVHNSFRKTYKGLTVVECLMCGWSWDRFKIDRIKPMYFDKLREFYLTWDYDSGKEAMKTEFPGIYNRIELQNARLRQIAIKEILEQSYDRLQPDIDLYDLEMFSLRFANIPTIAYALKARLLAVATGDDLADYYGAMPLTGPVRKITEDILQLDHTQYEHTIFCKEMAEKHGVNPVDINTLFYIMGQEL